MPYKNCQHILEDGHKCNRTFKVPTNRSSRKLCPEHERRDISKGAGIRNIQGKQEKMREFLGDLYSWKIEAIDRRIDRVMEQQRALDRKLDRVIDNMEKLDENFTNMKNLNSKVAQSIYHRGPEHFDKLQKQIITLNNKIIKISDENDKGNK